MESVNSKVNHEIGQGNSSYSDTRVSKSAKGDVNDILAFNHDHRVVSANLTSKCYKCLSVRYGAATTEILSIQIFES